MKYPKINFGTNKDLEKRFFFHFRKTEWAMRPELFFLFDDKFSGLKNKILAAYVDSYYEGYEKRINERVAETQKDWLTVENYFFKTVDKLFKNYSWPKGNYRAFVSIWNMFPRFIEDKIFTFPLDQGRYKNQKISRLVIAHEMLHFIAYDYLQKKYKLKPSEYNHKDNKFWQFTENLNVLIENETIWRKFTDGKSTPYPECARLYSRMKKNWNKNKDIDDLIRYVFKLKTVDA